MCACVGDCGNGNKDALVVKGAICSGGIDSIKAATDSKKGLGASPELIAVARWQCEKNSKVSFVYSVGGGVAREQQLVIVTHPD